MERNAQFEIDRASDSIQSLRPADARQHYEGVAFSTSGNTLAVAAAGTNSVLLFRRKNKYQFEEIPYWTIDGAKANLEFPHDVSFARIQGQEWLAAIQRRGKIAIWENIREGQDNVSDPAFEIFGPLTGLHFSDGVSFVPPNYTHVAACNYAANSITFYRRTSFSPVSFCLEPESVLQCSYLSGPDGLAFSSCGRWLAVANHSNNTASVFCRVDAGPDHSKLIYDPEPVSTIRDQSLCYPHSVAFSPKTNHLLVTNSGANYFNVYAPEVGPQGHSWSDAAVASIPFCSEELFKRVNTLNKMEGGPKGIAIHNKNLAVCSPEIGVKIYRYREHHRQILKRLTNIRLWKRFKSLFRRPFRNEFIHGKAL